MVICSFPLLEAPLIKHLHLLTLALLAPFSVFAQVRPLETGDIITRATLVANQVGANPITADQTVSRSYTLRVDADGNRWFTNDKGAVRFATNKAFTMIYNDGKPVPAKYQFVRFPVNEPLRPGMTWQAPVFSSLFGGGCGDIRVDYSSRSEEGSAVAVNVDGQATSLKTVHILHETILHGCGEKSWTRTQEVWYSPELNEIVKYWGVHYDYDHPGKLFLSRYGGDGWAITTVMTRTGR